MSKYNVELIKTVDDSYEIEIGYNLEDILIADIKNGLAGAINKFAVVTDSNVEPLYSAPIYEKLKAAGYKTDLVVFPAGEKSKTRATRSILKTPCLNSDTRGIA